MLSSSRNNSNGGSGICRLQGTQKCQNDRCWVGIQPTSLFGSCGPAKEVTASVPELIKGSKSRHGTVVLGFMHLVIHGPIPDDLVTTDRP